VGVADRLRSWARNPWLLIGTVIGLLLVITWLAWAIHVWADHGARQGIGVLIVWPAIVAVLALISIPFVWAFRVIRASGRSEEGGSDAKPEAGEADAKPKAAEAKPETADADVTDGDDGGPEPEAEAATG